MMLLILWKVKTGQRDAAVERFKQTQGAPPPSVKMLNRWHRTDGDGGITIAESNDAQALYRWAYQWSDLLTSTPIRSSTMRRRLRSYSVRNE